MKVNLPGERARLACWRWRLASANFSPFVPISPGAPEQSQPSQESSFRRPAHFSESAFFRFYLCVAAFIFIAATNSLAQQTPAPTPSPMATPTPTPSPSPARSVVIRFVPPPIEGAISLGVYDGSGKLVRVLHRESDTDDFTVGHDALITEWDGKNDAGEDLPAGKYSARGYAVGALSVEGVEYFFNDWVTDENSPHIARITGLSLDGGKLHFAAELASGAPTHFVYDFSRDAMSSTDPEHGAPFPPPPELKTDPVIDPISFAAGRNSTIWVVDHPEKNSAQLEIKQLSTAGEILRRLSYQPNDPQPKAIVATAAGQDKIFILEDNASVQRVRALSLVGTTTEAGKQQAISDWKVEFEKSIVAHQNFSLDNDQPVIAPVAGKTTPEKITQPLRPNPLKRDEAGSVDLGVGFDADGSYLKTTDGLPLRTISDTPNLSRALLISHGDKAIDVFQDDGAVVEQFRISATDQMMAFDCGDFELK